MLPSFSARRRSAFTRTVGSALLIGSLYCRASAGAALTPDDQPVDLPVLGGEVEDICVEGRKDSALLCLAYLRGTLDGLLYGQMDATGGLLSFCPPSSGIGLRETKAIFLDLVKGEPERRTEEASLVLLEALEQHFPCPEEKGDDDVPLLAGTPLANPAMRKRLVSTAPPSAAISARPIFRTGNSGVR